MFHVEHSGLFPFIFGQNIPRMEYLVLGIAALVGAYFYKQKEAAGHLLFFPGNITAMYFDNATPVAELTIQVQNTSNSNINLYSLAGQVYANGTLIGNISNFSGVTITANSSVLLPITVQFSILGAVNDLIRSFQTGQFRQDISIEGYVNAANFQVPLKLTFKIG